MQYHFHSRRLLLVEAVAAAVLLGACGGGGDLADPEAVDAEVVAEAASDDDDVADATQLAAGHDEDPAPADGESARDPTGEPWHAVVDDGTDPLLAAAEASEAADREQAMSTSYRKPKIAAIDYSRTNTSARRAYLAKFDFVLLGLTKSMGGSTMNYMTSDIKARNPGIKIAQYTVLNEVPCSVSTGHDHYDMWLAVNKADWWLRTGSGSRSQWTTSYNACDINVTSWGKRHPSTGQTWLQYKWDRDWNVFYKNMPKVDYVHIDNFFRRYRKNADFKRAGYNQDHTDPYYAAKWRAGMMQYVERVRTKQPQLKISVNADSNLAFPEYAEKVDMAFLEGVVGKSWSAETRSWKEAMTYYTKAIANAKGSGNAIFQAITSPTDYRLVRYSLASAMMADGYFMQTNNSGGQLTSWFDEFNARIGKPIQSPPTGPKQNGIWMRKYENGLVLVNPSKTSSASIYVGSGYRRLSGTQDPAVNNGKTQSTVTLPPRSGLLMLRS